MDRVAKDVLRDNWTEESKVNNTKIKSFAKEHGLKIHEYSADGIKLLLLDETDTGVDQETLDRYIKEKKIAEQNVINDNCFEVAQSASKRKTTTGCLSTETGTAEFVGWGNHCINYDLDKSSALAVDFTSDHNIDHYADNFDILAIKSPSFPSLIKTVGKLYGGNWVIEPTEK